MKNIYKPIEQKINSWICYNNNKPTMRFKKDPIAWENFKREYTFEYTLTGGNINADTIFPLWMPLRFTLVAINGYAKIKKTAGNINHRDEFMKNLAHKEVLKELLPEDNYRVKNLSELFELGQTKANVMILPERWMKKRASSPYYDYMPYFLYECFKGGEFFSAFKTEEQVKKWILEQSLDMFFYGEIKRNTIIDISGSKDIKCGTPDEIDFMVHNYIDILNQRKLIIGC
ncbi:MAG: hypothetical protein ACI4FZ_03025 [Lachnospiraceae bacterium]